jgi:hypothetical protein
LLDDCIVGDAFGAWHLQDLLQGDYTLSDHLVILGRQQRHQQGYASLQDLHVSTAIETSKTRAKNTKKEKRKKKRKEI